MLGSPILFCLLAGAVLGCIQGVGADLVLAHEQLAGGYVANNLLVAAALAIAAALVGGGAAFAHDGDDARLLAYARLTVIVALVLALCLANVLMMSGTFVSLTAAKLIGALLLAYAWFAACARPGARAVRALTRMLVCWQVAAALLQAAVMAMAGEGPVQVVNVIVVILLGAVLVMQLFPLFLSSRPATFPTGPSNGQTRSQALSISADEADLALVERFADEYGLTPRERELLGFFAQGYSVAYAVHRAHAPAQHLREDGHALARRPPGAAEDVLGRRRDARARAGAAMAGRLLLRLRRGRKAPHRIVVPVPAFARELPAVPFARRPARFGQALELGAQGNGQARAEAALVLGVREPLGREQAPGHVAARRLDGCQDVGGRRDGADVFGVRQVPGEVAGRARHDAVELRPGPRADAETVNVVAARPLARPQRAVRAEQVLRHAGEAAGDELLFAGRTQGQPLVVGGPGLARQRVEALGAAAAAGRARSRARRSRRR